MVSLFKNNCSSRKWKPLLISIKKQHHFFYLFKIDLDKDNFICWWINEYQKGSLIIEIILQSKGRYFLLLESRITCMYFKLRIFLLCANMLLYFLEKNAQNFIQHSIWLVNLFLNKLSDQTSRVKWHTSFSLYEKKEFLWSWSPPCTRKFVENCFLWHSSFIYKVQLMLFSTKSKAFSVSYA